MATVEDAFRKWKAAQHDHDSIRPPQKKKLSLSFVAYPCQSCGGFGVSGLHSMYQKTECGVFLKNAENE